ncbi:MAG: response regulator transcription factor [Bacteroidales bacterium]|nr:response regulator transcription factor [Bacteroidales bacterium]
MKCIAVDDEPLALELLEDFISKVPFLKLKALCKNAFEAIEALEKDKIDLIFLDIQMPDLSGIQLFRSLSSKPLVIFTTAYSNYAVEGFDLDATDYLVKPFSFDRFLKAVSKAYRQFNKQHAPPIISHDKEKKTAKEFIFVKEGTTTVKIILNDILYIEGLKDYIKIFTSGKTILTLMSLKAMEKKLPGDYFVRVHRSYIIAVAKIDSIERSRIIIGKKWIPVGDFYKENFQRMLKKYG